MGEQMAAQQKDFRRTKSIFRAAAAAIALATLSYTLSGASLECALLHPSPWLAANIVRLLILGADWQTLIPYLSEGSSLLQHFLEFVACP
jgi:hypothetical protein